MTQVPLDVTKLQSILTKGDDPTPTRKRSKSEIDTTVRTVTVWFKLFHSFGECSNPNCTDDRESTKRDGKAMVADINGVLMCRYCFYANYTG